MTIIFRNCVFQGTWLCFSKNNNFIRKWLCSSIGDTTWTMFPKEYGCFPHGNGFSWDKCVGLLPKEILCSPPLQEHKVFFTRKIGQKAPQMAPIWFDEGVILDKSFRHGHFDRVFLVVFFIGFFTIFFTNQLKFDSNHIWFILK